MAGLRSFDAFPKTDESHKQRSSKGGLSSILTYLFLLFMCWTEFGSYFGGYIDQQYRVDDQVKETFQINMDMYVHMPCKWVHINVRDQTMDRKLVSNELNLEDMPFFVPYGTMVNDMRKIATPALDEILAEAIPAQFRDKMDQNALKADLGDIPFDGCHIYGSVPVNRVSGELQITAKGWGYSDFERAPMSEINFSHVINEFSYGDFFPYIDNPLDSTAKVTVDSPFTGYIYDTSIVPTVYEKLGALVDTNQYAVSERQFNPNAVQQGSRNIPGIYFRYDFEPLSILIKDQRLSFVQFVIRLVALLSFVVYIASWTFRMVDLILIVTLGPKWSLRYQPSSDSHGILDR
ncbi:hypothetical protein HG537_0C05910 [Torulaspora globosa]|uniref:Endoplasmic reticulum-Golgi intermediate compartment protein n=1 Tax=Torulaspora globosa TaxID=48254 RepID=A0A7H9HUA6_9SACH|nr:hypothetical protein HG537_0C05910 [Torulaspora sp. CBS 2947]